MISLSILNKPEEKLALSMLTNECRRTKTCPLDNPLYKVAIVALTHSTAPSQCPFSKDCEQVKVEDWIEVCKPKPDPATLSNLAPFIDETVGKLARKLAQDCHNPIGGCPVTGLLRDRIYEWHGLNLRKRCPFFVIDCGSVTEELWESELILAAARKEAMKK